MILGAILGVVAVICRLVLWSLVRQYIFRARLQSGSGWRGVLFSGRRGYSNRPGPAQAPDLYVVDLPGRAPLGYCWECGRKIKPSQAVCFACGAAQVQSPPTGGYASAGPPPGFAGPGRQAAPGFQTPPYAPSQYPQAPYGQPPYAAQQYPEYRQPPYPAPQQYPQHAPFPQCQRNPTWEYPPDGRS